MKSQDAQADQDAGALARVQALAETLIQRRSAPRPTIYGSASVRAFNQIGRLILKTLNDEGKKR